VRYTKNVNLAILQQYGLREIIQIVGYPGLWAIVFAESGLFFGFFLPGDSLLVSAGLLASQNIFNIYVLLFILPIAAILGDSVGYWFGRRLGPQIFKQKTLLNKKHVRKTHDFYKKHGGKTIVMARFIPIIRTFAPIVAGAVGMKYRRFIPFSLFGGMFWVVSMLLLGFYLGSSIPNIDEYLIFVIAIIVFISFLPGIVEYSRARLS